jgi:ferredoxin
MRAFRLLRSAGFNADSKPGNGPRQSPGQRLRQQQRFRKVFQSIYVLLTNSYLAGFFKGTIYQGPLKNACVPGLNCYSCPGALGSCPLGALQNSFGDPRQRLSLYVIGFLTVTGGLLGRAVCGWLCPFGLVQDGLHKIPSPKLKPEHRAALHHALRQLKYLLLGLLVIALPFLATLGGSYGDPYFCKYVCPSGTLMAGIPLLAVNDRLRALAGWLFGWKALILLIVIALAVMIKRPFCRYGCPLGAIYGFFNRISLYRVVVDHAACIQCGACTAQCPMAVTVPADPNTAECIRCGECEAVCPTNAIKVGFRPAAWPIPQDQGSRLQKNSR